MIHDPQEITAQVIIALADTMAASAVSFSSHGYDQFILARDLFISTTETHFAYVDRLRYVHTYYER